MTREEEKEKGKTTALHVPRALRTHPSQYMQGMSVPTSAYQLLDSPPCFCQWLQMRPSTVVLPRKLASCSQLGLTIPQKSVRLQYLQHVDGL